MGRLGKHPELRAMQNGENVANLTIATSERWKDKNGQPQEKTEWHRVVIFGKTADAASQYLDTGARVYIEGKLQTRKWTDNQGIDKYTTEIIVSGYGGKMVIIDWPGNSKTGQANDYQANNAVDSYNSAGADNSANAFDDEIPF